MCFKLFNKNKMKKIIGILMIVLLYIGVFIYTTTVIGFKQTLIWFLICFGIIVFAIIAGWLIASK